MLVREILPEIVLGAFVAACAVVVGTIHVGSVASSPSPSGSQAEAPRQRAERRMAAAVAFYNSRVCSTARFIETDTSSDCPGGMTVTVSAEGPVPGLSKDENVAAKMTDAAATTMWCGLVATGKVTLDFSTPAVLENIHVELAEKDSKLQPTVKDITLVFEWRDGTTEAQVDTKTGTANIVTPGASASHVGIIPLSGHAGMALTVPLAATTKQLTMRAKPKNGWPGQMFCVGTLQAFGKPIEAADGRSTVLGIVSSIAQARPPLSSAVPIGLTLLKPTSVAASSAIQSAGESHPAEHAFDGNPKTAWNESVPGPGRGEWIEATYATPVAIRKIHMTTGYAERSQKFGDLFALNAHLKKVTVLVDGRAVRTANIDESQRDVTFDGLSESGKTVRFVADDVYEGTRWEDLCISEIEIYGVPSPAARPGAEPQTAPTNGSIVELAPDDRGFVDARGGWGWGDRCWRHIKSGQLGWAKAECDKGMEMNPASPQPLASLLYNEGVIEQKLGSKESARNYYQRSLALRPNPEVQTALDSLDRP